MIPGSGPQNREQIILVKLNQVSKLFWKSLDKSRSRKLLGNNRSTQGKKMNLTTNDECRYCKGLDSTETITHLLLDFTRFLHLGIVSQRDIKGLDGKTILKFLNDWLNQALIFFFLISYNFNFKFLTLVTNLGL